MIKQAKLTLNELLWQSLIFLALTFSAIFSPLSLTFELPFDKWALGMDGLISILFILDIIFKIKNRIKNRAKSRYVSKKVRIQYRIALVIDIIAAIPFDLIYYFLFLPVGGNVFRILRFLRILKIINVYTHNMSFAILPRIIKFQFVVICTIIALNAIACGWIMIYPVSGTENVYTYYNKALYWAVTTLTTIGYGDITPSTNLGRFYTMVIMLLGVGMYSLVIGNVARMISMADRYKEQSREKIHSLSQFMRHYNIPEQLQHATFGYYHHLFTKRLSDNDTQIIADLPNALQAELKTYMNLKLVGAVPAFKKCSHNCLKDIASSLKQSFYSPRQTIIRQGEIGNEMYIIGHGVVELINKDKDVVATLHEGQCFGEAALLEESIRSTSVKAQTYSDLYILSKEDFLNIIKKHPELLKSISKVMTRRASDRKS